MNIGKVHFGFAESMNDLITVGGFQNGNYIKEVERYKFSTKKWEKMKELRTGRSGVGLCNYKNEFLYCFGGYNGKYLSTIERLDINQNE